VDGFDLTPDPAPPPGLLTPKAMAAVLGVSVETLRVWRIEKGCPATKGAGTFGQTFYYDKDAVLAWRDRNIAEGVGGKREGAGRKKKGTGHKAQGTGGKTSAQCPVPSAPLLDAAAADKAERERDERRIPTDIDEIVTWLDNGNLTAAKAKMLADAMRGMRSAVALKVERGELLPVEDVRATWASLVADLIRALEALSGSAASAVLAAAGLPPERGPAVRRVIDDEVRAMRRRLVDGLVRRGVPARPDDRAAAPAPTPVAG
jgi:hypothetical protein